METYSLRLSEKLRDVADVDVIALAGRKDGSVPGVAALLGFGMTAAFRLLARRRPATVVHVADMAIWPLAVIARLRAPATRIALSAHGTDVSFPLRGGLKGRLYGGYLRLGAFLLRNARVVANSRATRDAVASYGYGDLRVVALATDMKRRDVAGHDGRILFSGRLIKLKGCGWFVRNVLPDLPGDITLSVAGTVWDEDERRALAAPRVEYLGLLDQAELAEAYARSLCVIVPNIPVENGTFEGFGLVAIEAAAAGGIVLAAAHGGLREAVIDKKTGFLLPPADAAAWQEAIAEVAGWSKARRAEFIDASATHVADAFSWARVAAETFAAYDLDGSPEPGKGPAG